MNPPRFDAQNTERKHIIIEESQEDTEGQYQQDSPEMATEVDAEAQDETSSNMRPTQ